MPTRLRALRNDRVDAPIFQPARLFYGCRGRHHAASDLLDADEQGRLGKPEMKTYNLRPSGLDYSAHGVVEGRKINGVS